MTGQRHTMVDYMNPPRAVPTDPRRPGQRRLTVNISPPERAARVLIGAATVIAGVVLLTAAGSALSIVLELLLIVAGLALVVTGALGTAALSAPQARAGVASEADMTDNRTHDVPPQPPVPPDGTHGGHSWMMIACCIPMLVIAVALVVSGVVSAGFSSWRSPAPR